MEKFSDGVPLNLANAIGVKQKLLKLLMLIFSQVILSIQLPFAIVPLVMFTADRGKLGELIAPRWLTALAALTAVTVIVLNIKLLVDFLAG